MIFARWIIVNFIAYSSYGQAFGQNYNPYDQYNYENGYNSLPQYLYYPNALPIPLVTAPVPCNNNSNNSTGCQNTPASGSSLYLLLDPKTQSLSIQVTQPCNQTNATATNPQKPSNGTGSPGAGGSNSDTGTCSTITLIKNIIDGLIEVVREILTTLQEAVIKLLQTIIGSLFTPILQDLDENLDMWLNNTLITLLNNMKEAANITASSNALVVKLLTDVDNLLAAKEGPDIKNVSANVNKLLNDTLLALLENVEELVLNLFDGTKPPATLPALKQNITSLLNTTMQSFLSNVNTTAVHLLNELFGNNSLITNFTNNTEVLLTDVSNDTICDLQYLFNETDNISSIITNVKKLLDDLVTDTLQDITGLLSKVIEDEIGNEGIVTVLLEDIRKLLSDYLLELFRQRINDIPFQKPDFKTNILSNLTLELTKLLVSTPPSTLQNDTSSPSIEVPQIEKLVENLLDQILGSVNDLVANVTNSSAINDSVAKVVEDFEKLVESTLKLLQDNSTASINSSLSNSSNLIDLPTQTQPIGALITDGLRAVYQCNVSCIPTNGTGGGSNNTTNGTTPIQPNPTPCPPQNGCPSLAYPDCSSAADQFLSQLQQYESIISRQFKNLNPSYSPYWDDSQNTNPSASSSPYSQTNNFDESVLQSLPDELLRGVQSTIQLTNDEATSGLLALVNSVAQSANSSDSLNLPILL